MSAPPEHNTQRRMNMIAKTILDILCWVRDVNHPRENHVFMIPITIKLIQIICHIFGLNLSFQLRKGQYFMAGSFNRTRLV